MLERLGFHARISSSIALLITLSTLPPLARTVCAGQPPITPDDRLHAAWWDFAQRAFPLGTVSPDARPRALLRMHAARLARHAVGLADVDGERWLSIGPAPIIDIFRMPVSGRVAAVAIDPAENHHWLAGAALGGVWETRDAGRTWQPKTDDQASLAIGALAFAPSDPSIIYAGTGEANFRAASYFGQGLLQSSDAGATWTLLASNTFAGTAFSDIKVHPSDPSTLTVATARGSAGRAAEWYAHLPPSSPPTGVFTSTDGGVSWSLRLSGQATDLEVDPAHFARQYAGVGEIFGSPLNGVFRSADSGATWERIDGPWAQLPGGVGRVEMAIAPSNPNVLFVSIQDALDFHGTDAGLLGLFRTDDAWAASPTWGRIDTGPTDDGSGLYSFCAWDPLNAGPSSQCWYGHELSVDPTNPDVLYAGGNPLWKLDGSTWTEISHLRQLSAKNPHPDQHSLVWAGNRLVIGNDGGVWSTADGGNTFTNHNRGLAITQFYDASLHPRNSLFAIAGCQDNGSVKWTGDAWTTIGVADGIDSAISSINPDKHWAIVTQFLDVGRSLNAPATPFDTKPAGMGIDRSEAAFTARIEKCPTNDDVFIAGSNNLWKSTNFFSAETPTWSANGPEMGACADYFGAVEGCITAMSFAASDASCNTYAYATGDGRLRLTTDGGDSWNDLDPGNGVPGRFVTDMQFDLSAATILYVTLSGFDDGTPGQPGHVFKTTSALAVQPVWVDVSPPVDLPQNTVALDPVDQQTVYVGADIGLWRSRDGGSSWVHMGSDAGMPNAAVYDVQIHPVTRQPFAFTYGRGAFTLACHGDVQCDDGNASNGTESCDVAAGRCERAVTAPTPSVTVSPTTSASVTATATPTASASATVPPTTTATSTPAATATPPPPLTRTPSPTGTVTEARPTLTMTPVRTATPVPSVTAPAPSAGRGGGCAVGPQPQHAHHAGSIWSAMALLVWLTRGRRRKEGGRGCRWSTGPVAACTVKRINGTGSP